MGRSDDNDIVVKGNLISRIHARIEQDRNKYLLIDQSTNGTFVHQSEGEDLFVRRDSMQLTGDGILGLGRATEHDSPLAIHFSTKK
jgi:pSer/pThr/pTyr-binding forkhead associated (FHA) protein